MVRTLLLAAIRALGMGAAPGDDANGACSASRRRGFSFGDRHGGTSPSKRLARILDGWAGWGSGITENRAGKASREVNSKPGGNSSGVRVEGHPAIV